jgi:hypothetical protein
MQQQNRRRAGNASRRIEYAALELRGGYATPELRDSSCRPEDATYILYVRVMC